MSQRKRRKTKTPAGSSRTEQISRCTALILIDGTRLRTKTLRGYLSAERNLSKAGDQLDTFETRDLPEFQRWEAQTFGAQLTEIREMQSAASSAAELLHAVRNEMDWHGCSDVEAYLFIMAERENSSADSDERSDDDEDPDSDGPDGFESDDDSEFGGGRPFDVHDFDRASPFEKMRIRAQFKAFAQFIEELTGEKLPSFEEYLDEQREAMGAGAKPGARDARDARDASANLRNTSASKPSTAVSFESCTPTPIQMAASVSANFGTNFRMPTAR